ncbi:hypothetical protein EsDP_00000668 [Epichloe bromicola]|uniref:Wax synthase domain-containing protein n=1 Tax=Epichloe bromicola TaxID=79588 RepID=A0ABQ0CFL2_9HYPO
MPRLDDAVRAAHRATFLDALHNGSAKPLLLPYSILGSFIVPALWLAVPHASRPWLYQTRWAVVGFVILFNVHVLRVCSSTNFAYAYAAGLMATWGIVLPMNLLVWKRPQFEAARVIRVAKAAEAKAKDDESADGGGHNVVTTSGRASSVHQGLRHRKLDPSTPPQDSGSSGTTTGDVFEYRWQTFPAEASFPERLGWAMDLMSSFRGAGWSYSISSIPRPVIPQIIHQNAKVDTRSIPRQTTSGYNRPVTETELVRSRLAYVLSAYLILDLLVLLAIHIIKDPFFILGPDNGYDLPPGLASKPPWMLLLYREAFSLVTIWASITAVFSLSDVVQYYFLSYFFPSRAILWQHASTFGTFSEVLDRGLAGWWGGWWHQTFRLELLAPSTYLLQKGYIKKGTQAAHAFGLFVTFLQCGLMHAAGSFTAIPHTKPWRSLLFFLLQGLGIAVQQRLALSLRNHVSKLPRAMRRCGNLAFCLVWLYFTAALFVNDLASMGFWLLEPVPISPLRLLGFGPVDDHWWRWDAHHLPKVYPWKHWWEIGVAL